MSYYSRRRNFPKYNNNYNRRYKKSRTYFSTTDYDSFLFPIRMHQIGGDFNWRKGGVGAYEGVFNPAYLYNTQQVEQDVQEHVHELLPITNGDENTPSTITIPSNDPNLQDPVTVNLEPKCTPNSQAINIVDYLRMLHLMAYTSVSQPEGNDLNNLQLITTTPPLYMPLTNSTLSYYTYKQVVEFKQYDIPTIRDMVEQVQLNQFLNGVQTLGAHPNILDNVAVMDFRNAIVSYTDTKTFWDNLTHDVFLILREFALLETMAEIANPDPTAIDTLGNEWDYDDWKVANNPPLRCADMAYLMFFKKPLFNAAIDDYAIKYYSIAFYEGLAYFTYLEDGSVLDWDLTTRLPEEVICFSPGSSIPGVEEKLLESILTDPPTYPYNNSCEQDGYITFEHLQNSITEQIVTPINVLRNLLGLPSIQTSLTLCMAAGRKLIRGTDPYVDQYYVSTTNSIEFRNTYDSATKTRTSQSVYLDLRKRYNLDITDQNSLKPFLENSVIAYIGVGYAVQSDEYYIIAESTSWDNSNDTMELLTLNSILICPTHIDTGDNIIWDSGLFSTNFTVPDTNYRHSCPDHPITIDILTTHNNSLISQLNSIITESYLSGGNTSTIVYSPQLAVVATNLAQLWDSTGEYPSGTTMYTQLENVGFDTTQDNLYPAWIDAFWANFVQQLGGTAFDTEYGNIVDLIRWMCHRTLHVNSDYLSLRILLDCIPNIKLGYGWFNGKMVMLIDKSGTEGPTTMTNEHLAVEATCGTLPPEPPEKLYFTGGIYDPVTNPGGICPLPGDSMTTVMTSKGLSWPLSVTTPSFSLNGLTYMRNIFEDHYVAWGNQYRSDRGMQPLFWSDYLCAASMLNCYLSMDSFLQHIYSGKTMVSTRDSSVLPVNTIGERLQFFEYEHNVTFFGSLGEGLGAGGGNQDNQEYPETLNTDPSRLFCQFKIQDVDNLYGWTDDNEPVDMQSTAHMIPFLDNIDDANNVAPLYNRIGLAYYLPAGSDWLRVCVMYGVSPNANPADDPPFTLPLSTWPQLLTAMDCFINDT